LWSQQIVVPAFGPQEAAKSTAIALSGPSTLNVGQDGVYRLSGTPAVDLSKPLLDQLGWALGADRMFLYVLAPSQPKQALDARLELVISAGGVELQPVIHLVPTVKGEHRIVVDWNTGQNQLAEILVMVGGDPNPPNPPDPPDPPDPPNPTSKWQVVFFHASGTLDNLPRAQIDMLSGLVFRDEVTAKGDRFVGSFNVDSVAKTVRTCDGTKCWTTYAMPAELVPFFNAVKGDPMPRVAIAPINGGAVRDFPLPENAAAFWTLLGGQK
jgi:hypothetical protein